VALDGNRCRYVRVLVVIVKLLCLSDLWRPDKHALIDFWRPFVCYEVSLEAKEPYSGGFVFSVFFKRVPPVFYGGVTYLVLSCLVYTMEGNAPEKIAASR